MSIRNLKDSQILLITGGAGFLGSHTALEAAKVWPGVVLVVDNFTNSKPRVAEVLKRSRQVLFETVDLLNASAVETLFIVYQPEAVIHFAAHKSVLESCQNPLKYYDENLRMLTNVLRGMESADTRRIIFSSSATVYGALEKHRELQVGLTENDWDLRTGRGRQRCVACPYAQTKRICEQMLHDVAVCHSSWTIVIMRYFNPIGAHDNGELGEDPITPAANVLPALMKTLKTGTPFHLFGDDYPTRDGTCERDFLHVMDMVEGHLCALRYETQPGLVTCNLGTGKPTSVLKLIAEVEAVTGRTVPMVVDPRRPGDLPSVFADVTRAKTRWNWSASRSLRQMVSSAIRFSDPKSYTIDTRTV